MVRIYALYEPLTVFVGLGGAAVLARCRGRLALRVRLAARGRRRDTCRASILAAVLVIVGFQTMLIGLVADLIGSSRSLVEDTLLRVRELELRFGREAGRRAAAGRQRPPRRRTPRAVARPDDGVPLRHVRSRPQREPAAAPRARRRGLRRSRSCTSRCGRARASKDASLLRRRVARPARGSLGRRCAPARARAGGDGQAARRWSWSGSAASSTCCWRRASAGRAPGCVFAPLVSLSETLVEDRQRVSAPAARARGWSAALDRATLRAADLVLADTAAHADYLRELGAPSERAGRLALRGGARVRCPGRARAGAAARALLRALPAAARHRHDRRGRRASRRRAPTSSSSASGPERPRMESLAAIGSGRAITWRDEVPLAALPRRAGRGVGGARRLRHRSQGGDGGAEQGLPGGRCRAPPGDTRRAGAARGARARRALPRLPARRPRCARRRRRASCSTIPALAARLGAAARAHVLARFGAAQVAARLADVLAATARRARRARPGWPA